MSSQAGSQPWTVSGSEQKKCGGMEGVEMGGVESENIDTYSYVVFIRAMTQFLISE